MKVSLIDRFIIPAKALPEFIEKMNYNRNFISHLPGFVRDEAYEREDENGDTIVVTVAVWESEAVIEKAKVAVQSEYKRIGFNLAQLLDRLRITSERGIYRVMAQEKESAEIS